MTVRHSSLALVMALACVGIVINRPPIVAQQRQPAPARAPRAQNRENAEVHTLHVQGNVYMLVSAGGNVTVQAGDEGVLLVDTSVAPMSDKIVAAVRTLSDKPIRYIINTHFHPDHTGGNEKIARLGSTIAGGNVGIGASVGASVIAHENVLNRMSAPTGAEAPTPFGAWPTDTFFTNHKELFFNGEAIQIIHQPAAHTDGDTLVFFRRSDVVSAGDLFVTTTFPVIDREAGGNIQGIIEGLNRLLDIAIPKEKQEGGTYVIPGHGRLCDEADVLEYRDMVTIIRDRILDMVRKGMTLEQVKAARPALDYDARYADAEWTTDKFIEAVYRSLSQTRPSAKP